MLKYSPSALPALLFALVPGTGVGQQVPSFKTTQDVSLFTETYYQHPRPELIGSLIEALYPTGVSQPTRATPFISFFSEVFAANPSRLPEWQALIDKQDASVRDALGRALALTKAGGVQAIEDHTPWVNDMYWGAFFASGRPIFLQKLVDQLRYWDERQNYILFAAGATAKWSLASNAQKYSLVREALDAKTLVADARTHALIAELLSQDPQSIRTDIFNIVKQQHGRVGWP
jgi:hypothetical protein